jgi:diacylglycerol kinase family enzyme
VADDTLEALGDARSLDAPTERRRMLVIVNPHATTVSDRLRHLVVHALEARYDVHAVDTRARDHATELCREAAAEGYDVVVAFGGDGTVNEAANGLAAAPAPATGPRPALTCLPGGATNVFGRMLGIPADVVDATEHLLRIADDWRPRQVDLPSVNGRRFTFSSGMGLDASVVERVDRHPRLKARLGAWYFAWAAASTFATRYVRSPPRLAVEAGGRSCTGVTAIVQNTDPFTYFRSRPIHLADAGTLDDGTMSGVVLRRSTPTVAPTLVVRLLSRRARVTAHRAVEGFAGVTEVVVRSLDGRAVPLQVDGDHIGDVVEARYEIEPGALRVVA